MKNFLSVAVFALIVSLFYTAVGNLLPQMESKPPARVKLGEASMSTDDLVSAGSGIFDANCAQCHKIGAVSRCPDLGGIGRRAHDRAGERKQETGKDYSDVDYLVESVCQPGAHVVQGFGNIMPPQGKVLSPGQIIAVAAFLQDQGADVTVSLADKAKAEEELTKFGCMAAGGGEAGGAAPAVAAAPVGKPDEVFTSFGCNACHAIDKPDRLIGPSLQDIGKRLDKGQIYEAILNPDASVAAGNPPYPAGMMSATLKGNGFYDRMKPVDFQALVDWLATHKG